MSESMKVNRLWSISNYPIRTLTRAERKRRRNKLNVTFSTDWSECLSQFWPNHIEIDEQVAWRVKVDRFFFFLHLCFFLFSFGRVSLFDDEQEHERDRERVSCVQGEICEWNRNKVRQKKNLQTQHDEWPRASTSVIIWLGVSVLFHLIVIRFTCLWSVMLVIKRNLCPLSTWPGKMGADVRAARKVKWNERGKSPGWEREKERGRKREQCHAKSDYWETERRQRQAGEKKK